MLDIIFIWTLHRTHLTTLEKLALCYYVVIYFRSNVLYLSSASFSSFVFAVDGRGRCRRAVAVKVYMEPGVLGRSVGRLIPKGEVLEGLLVRCAALLDGSATGSIWGVVVEPIQLPRLNCCAGRSSIALASWPASLAPLFSSFVINDSISLDSLRSFLQKENEWVSNEQAYMALQY